MKPLGIGSSTTSKTSVRAQVPRHDQCLSRQTRQFKSARELFALEERSSGRLRAPSTKKPQRGVRSKSTTYFWSRRPGGAAVPPPSSMRAQDVALARMTAKQFRSYAAQKGLVDDDLEQMRDRRLQCRRR